MEINGKSADCTDKTCPKIHDEKSIIPKDDLTLALSSLSEIPAYPLNFIKALMQMGHEPLAPFPSKTIFGKQKIFHPNSFAYMKHVYTLDGFTGLYRGLSMKIISTTVSNVVSSKVAKFIDENDVQGLVVPENNENTFEIFKKKASRDITIKMWAVVVSHPFHVMALRCMAQFVGGETNYSSWNIFHNAMEIYKGEGISGFFNGLIPRMLFEVSTIAIASTVAYSIKTYIFEDDDVAAKENFINMGSALLASSITYPLAVVTTVSCVAGSSLTAATPPKMPIYNSWIGVFKHLYESNGLKKGSSHFFRVYVPTMQFNSMSIY